MSNVFIAKGNLAGKGIYANRYFKKGEIVIKYNLKPITKIEYNKLSKNEQEFTHSFKGQIFLYSKPERYVNHSENPNTYQDHILKADIALRDIKKGELITCNAIKDDVR